MPNASHQRAATVHGCVFVVVCFPCLCLCPILAQEAGPRPGAPAPDPSIYFRIKVVDEETGRRIPLVKLATLTEIVHYTDSAGVVAFYEPALMNRKVFFYVESHGYEFKKDGFGCRGTALDVVPGGSAVLKMWRINVAQRLYRITGSGIYHDSILLRDPVPVRYPLANAGVMGQDSAIVAPYRGKLFWIWGDTTNIRYPIAANFKVTAATSDLPGKGGLDPEVGVDLTYFRKDDFVKPMVPLEGSLMYWLGSLLAAKDRAGAEHLVASYAKVKPPMTTVGRGMVEFNDDKQVFEQVREDPVDALIQASGMPFKAAEGGKDYFYYLCENLSRSPIDYDSVMDPKSYEAFTCLKEGCRYDGTKEQLDRAEDGALRDAWRRNTSPIGPKQLRELAKAGHMKPEEQWLRLVDIATGKDVAFHRGAIAYNPYRKRWVMIATQMFGASALGEIWYAEADTPIGPWTYARKIVTHDQYSFYNPIQHPHFAKDNGRILFFEGTYTKMFSGNKVGTPRYDYNQIMYKLDLDDPRLRLPVPVYRIRENGIPYRTGENIPENVKDRDMAFYALDRPMEGTMPVYAAKDGGGDGAVLTTEQSKAAIAFHALPAQLASPPPLTVALYEYRRKQNGERIYSIDAELKNPDYQRTEKPICRVWECPTRFNPFTVRSM